MWRRRAPRDGLVKLHTRSDQRHKCPSYREPHGHDRRAHASQADAELAQVSAAGSAKITEADANKPKLNLLELPMLSSRQYNVRTSAQL